MAGWVGYLPLPSWRRLASSLSLCWSIASSPERGLTWTARRGGLPAISDALRGARRLAADLRPGRRNRLARLCSTTLQRKHSAANSSLILALVWAGWHLPAFFFRDTYIELGVLGFPLFALQLVFTAMVFTWLYNGTGGSLLMVVLFHAVFNWLSVSEAGGQFAPIIMTVPIIIWALIIPRRYGSRTPHLWKSKSGNMWRAHGIPGCGRMDSANRID